ncbi:MAG: 50S ribosomal protein L22 [bacterium]|jgi:large subunit ribosomal protein L22|nr:50S ribosomal protein L22 [bacterium]
MEVKAKARYIRMSPRKVRLVVDLIRGLDVQGAQAQLSFSKKAAAEPVLKLLNSAIANATNNFKMNGDDLYVKTIMVDGGPTLKRWRPRAFGRAGAIRKRTSHINIVLASRTQQMKEVAEARKSSKAN